MASHPVYEAGYGRFLALEDAHMSTFAAGMLQNVHASLYSSNPRGSEGVLAESVTECIKASIAAFKVCQYENIVCERISTQSAALYCLGQIILYH
jgi:hypothetical protein